MQKALTTILLLSVLLLGFAACDGGGFVDPGVAGYNSGGGGLGGGGFSDPGAVEYQGGAGGGAGGGGGGGGGYGGGDGGTSGWPPQSVRSKYGIGSLSQPPGSNFMYITANEQGGIGLSIYFAATNQTATTLNKWFTSNGWKAYTSTKAPYYAWVKSGSGKSSMASYNPDLLGTGYAFLTVVVVDGEMDDDDWDW